MGVDHRRRDIAMSQQFLHSANIVSCLQHVRRETMPEGMAADLFSDVRTTGCDPHGALESGLVKMVPTRLPCCGLNAKACRRKHILSRPILWSMRVLSLKGRPESGSSVS